MLLFTYNVLKDLTQGFLNTINFRLASECASVASLSCYPFELWGAYIYIKFTSKCCSFRSSNLRRDCWWRPKIQLLWKHLILLVERAGVYSILLSSILVRVHVILCLRSHNLSVTSLIWRGWSLLVWVSSVWRRILGVGLSSRVSAIRWTCTISLSHWIIQVLAQGLSRISTRVWSWKSTRISTIWLSTWQLAWIWRAIKTIHWWSTWQLALIWRIAWKTSHWWSSWIHWPHQWVDTTDLLLWILTIAWSHWSCQWINTSHWATHWTVSSQWILHALWHHWTSIWIRHAW